VTIGLADSSVRLKTSRFGQVTVEVLPGPVERPVRDRPVRLLGAAPGLVVKATPNVVDVVLRGSREGVNAVAVNDVPAVVDVTGLGPGTYTLPVRVDNPPHAGVASVSPQTVQVSISSGRN
jgi:YbbR domain-containing protein